MMYVELQRREEDVYAELVAMLSISWL